MFSLTTQKDHDVSPLFRRKVLADPLQNLLIRLRVDLLCAFPLPPFPPRS
jgi:hypothetical protein